MLKLSIVTAALATAFITLAPISVLTGPATAAPLTYARSPNNPTPPKGTTYSCRNELGYLRRVYEEELGQIRDADRVWVMPVCLGEDYGLMRSDGNAGALRGGIAANDAIMQALLGKNFRPEDVVGIRMTGEDSAVIFVHPFHR